MLKGAYIRINSIVDKRLLSVLLSFPLLLFSKFCNVHIIHIIPALKVDKLAPVSIIYMNITIILKNAVFVKNENGTHSMVCFSEKILACSAFCMPTGFPEKPFEKGNGSAFLCGQRGFFENAFPL
jgi:hypothetical protein